MRVLVVGAGGVGSAFVAIASKRAAYTHITVSDIDVEKAEGAVTTGGSSRRTSTRRRRSRSPTSPDRCVPTSC
jgi:saccharopine dehydrogenase (NAD+, L-lysine-forming)